MTIKENLQQIDERTFKDVDEDLYNVLILLGDDDDRLFSVTMDNYRNILCARHVEIRDEFVTKYNKLTAKRDKIRYIRVKLSESMSKLYEIRDELRTLIKECEQ